VSNPEVVIVPIVFGLPTIAWIIRMYFRHREKMAGLGALPAQPSNVEARLERVEQAIEAVAVEIERIGESQRFLTKVLTESRPGLAAGPAERASGSLSSRG
jgi:hypothetical protein